MANWQLTLRLNPEWDQAQDGLISVQELARSVATKLRALKPFKSELDDINDEREEIIEAFEFLAVDEGVTQQDFNYLFEDLYNWGDQAIDGRWNGKKVCWVDTMTTVGEEKAS